MKLIVKTLYLSFLVSIINRVAPILAMFKHNLEALEFLIFELDLENVEIEAGVIWRGSNLPNLEIVTRLDFDE